MLETVQTILLTRDGYRQLVLGWGNQVYLEELGLLWLDLPVFIGISEQQNSTSNHRNCWCKTVISGSCSIQCFYAWRLYILSRSKVLCGTIAAVCHGHCLVMTTLLTSPQDFCNTVWGSDSWRYCVIPSTEYPRDTEQNCQANNCEYTCSRHLPTLTASGAMRRFGSGGQLLVMSSSLPLWFTM